MVPAKHEAGDLGEAALGVTAGAALVLDADLRVVLATPAARAILGGKDPKGQRAPALLCGDRPKRPVAEALAEGRPIQALVPGPRGRGTRPLRVSSLPIGGVGGEPGRAKDARARGWILLLDEGTAAGAEGPVLFHGMWTQAPRMKEVCRIVERVAADDVTVLVRGETGSGKELVAHAIHALSARSRGPFRAINCAALPPNLLESELFGHARGAFTGALRDTPGHVQLAHKGTLFLDEVAELPLELQAKLLRVLETRTVVAVGARDPVPVDVRVVSATHRALRKEVEAGRFRADLMYRLRVIPIFLPPLRERAGDVALLSDKLIASMNGTKRRRIARGAPGARAVLERHDWPGNVRELMNALSYAYAIGEGPVLQPSDLPPELLDPEMASDHAAAPGAPAQASEGAAEGKRIREVLARTGGNRNQAARILGLSRVTLWRRMRALGLLEPRSRRPAP